MSSWAPSSSLLPSVEVWAGCWDCARQQPRWALVILVFLGNRQLLPAKHSLEGWQSFLPTSQWPLSTAQDAQLQRFHFLYYIFFTLPHCWGAVCPCGGSREMPKFWWWHRHRLPGLGLHLQGLAELPCLSALAQWHRSARLGLTFHWHMQFPWLSLENMRLRLNQEWGQVLSCERFPYMCFSQVEQPHQDK